MSKQRKIALYIIIALIVLTIGYIWLNSSKSKEQSSENSEQVSSGVQEMADAVFGKDTITITNEGMRKFAHFIEFAALGAEFCALYIVLKKQSFDSFLQMLPFGLYVAVIDEGIQILSDRGPEVRDIFIDYSGYLAATLIFFIVFVVRRTVKTRKNSRPKAE